MTHTHAEFVAAVCAAPAEDTPRLVYADWLDEHADARLKLWAEFIRVQVKLAVAYRRRDSRGNAVGLRASGVWGLDAREEELMDALADGADGRFRRYSLSPGLIVPEGDISFSRGFVHWVVLTAEQWLAHADQIYWHPDQHRECPETAQPLERVVLTSMPPDMDWYVALGYPNSIRWGRWPHIEFTLPQGGYPLPAEEQDPAVIPPHLDNPLANPAGLSTYERAALAAEAARHD